MRYCKTLTFCIFGDSGDKICHEPDCPPHLTESEGYKLYMSFFEPKMTRIEKMETKE